MFVGTRGNAKHVAAPRTFAVASALAVACAALSVGCAAKTDPLGGETNWFTACDEDSDCDGTSCLCGACSTECTEDSDCDMPDAVCADSDGAALGAQCGAAQPPICLPVCSRDGDCSNDQRCMAGTCVLTSPGTDAGAGMGVTCDQSLPMAAHLLSGEEGTLPEGRGSVLEVGTGVPPDEALGYRAGCVGEFEWALTAGQLDLDGDTDSDLRWLRFDHEGSEHWLTLQASSLELPLAAGDSFSLSTGYECDFQGATDSFVELRDESDELVFWLSQAYSFEDVETPAEISLAPGDTICVGEYWNTLQVEVTLDGVTRSIQPGTQVKFGAFVFTHGSYNVRTRSPPSSDSSGSFIRMAAWRR